MCPKVYKTKNGLNRHTKAKHNTDAPTKELTIDHLKEFIDEMGSKVYNNLCYPEVIRNAFSTEIHTNFDALLQKIQCIYADWQENPDADIFYKGFHNEIVCKSQTYFCIDYPLAGIATTTLCDIVFCSFNKRGKSSLPHKPITEVEKDGIQYLAGYVIQKLIKKAEKLKSATLLDILGQMVTTDNNSQKLIQIQSRGGLTVATLEANQIFFKAEEIFRARTANELQKI